MSKIALYTTIFCLVVLVLFSGCAISKKKKKKKCNCPDFEADPIELSLPNPFNF
jgi:hypothetical protein